MRQTPLQRRLDTLEDRIFRLSRRRRDWCERQAERAIGRHLEPGHQAVTDFLHAKAAYRDRQIISIAQAHRVRCWTWLPLLLLLNSLTSGIDVAEYALAWFVVVQRWIPRRVASWSMATAAILAADLRRARTGCPYGVTLPGFMRARYTDAPPVPLIVVQAILTIFEAPLHVWRVCQRGLGTSALGWWRGRADGDETQHERFDLLPFAAAALLLLMLSIPEAHAAGLMTAAISSTAVFEVRTGGSDNNGGGFNAAGSSPGTDRSLQTAAQVVIDGTVISATVQATTTQLKFGGSSGYTTIAADNRNILQITGGTATAGFYEITAVTAGAPGTGIWTVDRSMGTNGQTIVGNMGGCLASPGKAGAAAPASTSCVIWIATGTYTLTSSSNNVSGGANAVNTGTIEGYGVTRGDLASPPTIAAGSVNTVTMISNGSEFCRNLIVDGNSQTAVIGIRGNTYLCQVLNCTGANGALFGGSVAVRSTVTSSSSTPSGAFNAITVFGCEAYSNSCPGYRSTVSGTVLSFSITYNNTGASSDGVVSATAGGYFVNCVAYNNGRDGFRLGDIATGINSIAEGQTAGGAFGFSAGGATRYGVSMLNCAAYNNTTNFDTTRLTGDIVNSITGTASFFVDASNNNFALNTAAGGGALARNAGYPGAFPRGTTTGYASVGAVTPPPLFPANRIFTGF